MKDHRTEFEKDMTILVLDMIEILANPLVYRFKLLGIMNQLRMLKTRLINKSFGCVSGKHASECLCDKNIEVTTQTYKRKAKGRFHETVSNLPSTAKNSH